MADPTSSFLLAIVLRAAVFTYGLACFCGTVLRAEYMTRFTEEGKVHGGFWRRVDDARRALYSDTSTSTYRHAFFNPPSHPWQRIHYLVSHRAEKPTNLIVFLHGWPDSAHLWGPLWSHLPQRLRGSSVLLAPDLPGFGGSDQLATSGPDDVLDALVEFVVEMKREVFGPHRKEGGRLLLVGHDWGGVCAFRLASQAGGLIDGVVVANAPVPTLALRNTRRALHSSKDRLADSLTSLLTLHPLRAARSLQTCLAALRPALDQLLLKSFYIYIFNLPGPLPRLALSAGQMGFLRYVSLLALFGTTGPASGIAERIERDEAVARHLGGFLGPLAEDGAGGDGAGYGDGVEPLGTSTRIYGEGMATRPWRASPPVRRLLEDAGGTFHAPSTLRSARGGTPAAAAAAVPEVKVPVTLVWGERDVALSSGFLLQGLLEGGEGWVGGGSCVVKVGGLGHWVPCEMKGGRRKGVEVLGGVLDVVLRGQGVDGVRETVGGLEGVEVVGIR